ncbi:MAG: hypothetical protein JXR22_00080 [Prolixibacteraceae bacterium]|nr:hypothetical protein [Prolixibacteraceae bacterium]
MKKVSTNPIIPRGLTKGVLQEKMIRDEGGTKPPAWTKPTTIARGGTKPPSGKRR